MSLRLLAAMSGGVDSAVAAARAVAAGHEVTGVHLALARDPRAHRDGARGCCTLEDARDARRSADVLGIPFYVWDVAGRFDAEVVADFVNAYAAGRTPNPCVRCNERIKFAAVLDRAQALGFDQVVTGHYARLDSGVLRRGVDVAKDQSYVLAGLDARQLAGAYLPLGGSTKAEVRLQAAALRLAVAGKPDSHDTCFVPDGDIGGFLHARIGPRRGEIIEHGTGRVLGRHAGAEVFTIGQRRGLGLTQPGPDGARRYVVDVDVPRATVTVGSAADLLTDFLVCSAPRLHGGASTGPRRVRVQLRAHPPAYPASCEWFPETVTVRLDAPVRRVAPGQLAVFYDEAGDEVVLGSATVESSPPPRPVDSPA